MDNPSLSESQKRFRIFLVASAFILFSIILVGLFWLSQSTRDQAGWLAFSYATGLSMIVLPCTLPLAFVIVPLAMGKSPKKGLAIAIAFAIGVTLTLSIYGAIIAKLGQVVGLDRAKDIMYLIAGAFAVVFGLGELGLIKMRVPTYSGAFPKFIQERKDVGKGFLLGLLLGNVGLGCPNPAFYVLLSHIATVGSMGTGWFLTFIHAIGRVTPLILLAILAVLGVDALSVLVKRKDSIARATAWGVVGVGAFILTYGLLGHDWYVYSGIHSLLELVTREASFVTRYAEQYGGIAHAHGVPVGPYLKYGSWLMATLIVIPLVWNWRKKKKETPVDNPEAIKTMRWFGAYTKIMVLFVYLLFAITLPNWFIYKVAPSQQHAMPAQVPAAATADLAVALDAAPAAIKPKQKVSLEFTVWDKNTGKIVTNLDLAHGKLMHVVGVRREDTSAFFHIHPDLTGNKFVVTYTFEEEGTYNVWPGIQYGGNHVTTRMQELVVGQPKPIVQDPSLERTQKLGEDLVVSLKAAPKLSAGTLHNLGFSITDRGGFYVPVQKYVQEDLHINIVSQDLHHYHHLHTNYGQIGEDHNSGAGGHMHSLSPESVNRIVSQFIQTVYAEAGHDPGMPHSLAPADEESLIGFDEKDLRIRMNFPDPGKYKLFGEFVTRQEPQIVQRAEFWVNVEPASAVVKTSSPPSKPLLAIISLLIIFAIMPSIHKYLKEERIKV